MARPKKVKIVPEQARGCKFYTGGKCDITKGGKLICENKKCTLCIGK